MQPGGELEVGLAKTLAAERSASVRQRACNGAQARAAARLAVPYTRGRAPSSGAMQASEQRRAGRSAGVSQRTVQLAAL
jgi:hypothetical protein